MKSGQKTTRNDDFDFPRLASISVRFGRKTVRLALHEAGDGVVVKRGRAWVRLPGSHSRITYNLAEVLELVGRELADELGMPFTAEAVPNLPRGSRVRVPSLRSPGYFDVTRTISEPLRDAAGGWWTLVCNRREPVRVADLVATS